VKVRDHPNRASVTPELPTGWPGWLGGSLADAQSVVPLLIFGKSPRPPTVNTTLSDTISTVIAAGFNHLSFIFRSIA
jgi:hypothetical protein